ncbi:MAG: hypothetical protein KIT31_26180 [Deltaproteobacteria bacterium]|nr:hypothetical protein [Deltaproteobacteria bacterium]
MANSAPIHLLIVGGEARSSIRAVIAASDLGAHVDEVALPPGARDVSAPPRVSNGHDCVILGPDRDNTEPVFAYVRDLRASGNAIPVIVVLPAPEDEVLQTALDAGATDYVLAQDLSPRRLALRIRFALRVGRAESASAKSLADATTAARARDDMLAIVSHDLRGPLHAISLATEALSSEVGDDARRYTAAIDRAIVRAERLISDLLDAAALENGAMSINKRSVDAVALVRQAVADHELIVRESGATISTRLPPGAVAVTADRDRILQVLANLLGNAMKHARGSAIEVSVERVEREAAITVRDRGPGIGASELPHVFDRYWRGRAKKGGAGLGLAIARGIVEAHGGTLRATSVPGEGAAFSFTLPLA